MSEPMRREVGEASIELVTGDITEQDVDVIVNAANARLAGGGGVDGAIHRRGGPQIMAETKRRYPHGCPTGSAVISGAGDLHARWVIHAVGPRWRGGGFGEELALGGAYRRALDLAVEAGARSMAFPAISTGVYGYPLAEASRVAIGEVASFLRDSGDLRTVRFCLFGDEALAAFRNALSAHAPGA